MRRHRMRQTGRYISSTENAQQILNQCLISRRSNETRSDTREMFGLGAGEDGDVQRLADSDAVAAQAIRRSYC